MPVAMAIFKSRQSQDKVYFLFLKDSTIFKGKITSQSLDIHELATVKLRRVVRPPLL